MSRQKKKYDFDLFYPIPCRFMISISSGAIISRVGKKCSSDRQRANVILQYQVTSYSVILVCEAPLSSDIHASKNKHPFSNVANRKKETKKKKKNAHTPSTQTFAYL